MIFFYMFLVLGSICKCGLTDGVSIDFDGQHDKSVSEMGQTKWIVSIKPQREVLGETDGSHGQWVIENIPYFSIQIVPNRLHVDISPISPISANETISTSTPLITNETLLMDDLVSMFRSFHPHSDPIMSEQDVLGVFEIIMTSPTIPDWYRMTMVTPKLSDWFDYARPISKDGYCRRIFRIAELVSRLRTRISHRLSQNHHHHQSNYNNPTDHEKGKWITAVADADRFLYWYRHTVHLREAASYCGKLATSSLSKRIFDDNTVDDEEESSTAIVASDTFLVTFAPKLSNDLKQWILLLTLLMNDVQNVMGNSMANETETVIDDAADRLLNKLQDIMERDNITLSDEDAYELWKTFSASRSKGHLREKFQGLLAKGVVKGQEQDMRIVSRLAAVHVLTIISGLTASFLTTINVQIMVFAPMLTFMFLMLTLGNVCRPTLDQVKATFQEWKNSNFRTTFKKTTVCLRAWITVLLTIPFYIYIFVLSQRGADVLASFTGVGVGLTVAPLVIAVTLELIYGILAYYLLLGRDPLSPAAVELDVTGSSVSMSFMK